MSSDRSKHGQERNGALEEDTEELIVGHREAPRCWTECRCLCEAYSSKFVKEEAPPRIALAAGPLMETVLVDSTPHQP
jgi:hypothetical protein